MVRTDRHRHTEMTVPSDKVSASNAVWIVLAREVAVSRIPRVKHRLWNALVSLGLALVLVVPLRAYEFPLSSSDIRDAYFVAHQPGVADFFGKYSHAIPELNVGKEFVTRVPGTPISRLASMLGF